MFCVFQNLKPELETIRQTNNLAKISQKEREIADRIQDKVSRFSYKSSADNPAEMTANQYINCVGASTLGGALMKEAGLYYLVGSVPKHSILFLVTSDGEVEWRDMLDPSLNEKLTDEMIEGRKKDGTPLTIKDIAAFGQKPTPEGLMFDIKSYEKYKEKLGWVREGQRRYVAVFEPEYGQQIQILNNMGDTLLDLDLNKEAVETYRQAIALDPKDVDPYNGLGEALSNLGLYKEAIEAYRKFINLADKKQDDYWIKQAKGIITELKKKAASQLR